MPEAGSYTPKFKIGQTVTSPTQYPDRHLIVFSTYKSLSQFSKDYANASCPIEFDESEIAKVMYVAWETENTNYYWVHEEKLELVCSNCNRGKKILLEPKNLSLIALWFNFSNEGLIKLKEILQHQPPTDT